MNLIGQIGNLLRFALLFQLVFVSSVGCKFYEGGLSLAAKSASRDSPHLVSIISSVSKPPSQKGTGISSGAESDVVTALINALGGIIICVIQVVGSLITAIITLWIADGMRSPRKSESSKVKIVLIHVNRTAQKLRASVWKPRPPKILKPKNQASKRVAKTVQQEFTFR